MKQLRYFPRFSVIPLLAMLAACSTVGPNYSSPKPNLPATFANASANTATSTNDLGAQQEWWRQFADQDLNALIERALTAAPDITLARARMAQARSVQRVQDAATAPALGVGAKVASDKLSKNSEMLANLPVKNVNTDFTNHQIGFDAAWEIDFWGRQQRISEATQAKYQASTARVDDLRLILAAEVTRNYIELRSNAQRRQLARENLQQMNESLRLLGVAHKLGEAAQLDVQRLTLARDNFQASMPGLELAYQQNLAALMVLCDSSQQELQARLATYKPLMAMPAAPSAGLPAQLLQRRADIRVAERELAAASAEIGIAQAALYPRISLLGNAGWTSISSSSLLESASRNWSIGPQLSMPILAGDRLKGQVAAQQAAYEASLASYRKAVMNALAEVEVSLQRIAQSEARRGSTMQALHAQQDILRLQAKQWQHGEIAKTSLLDAEKALILQQDASVQAHTQSLIALVSLYKAMGGGWQQ